VSVAITARSIKKIHAAQAKALIIPTGSDPDKVVTVYPPARKARKTGIRRVAPSFQVADCSWRGHLLMVSASIPANDVSTAITERKRGHRAANDPGGSPGRRSPAADHARPTGTQTFSCPVGWGPSIVSVADDLAGSYS
jgi:hypothetical protein